MRHFLLTRYNMGLYGLPGKLVTRETVIDQDAWEDHRLSLFAKYTVRSVRAQRCQDFEWILAMDYRTSETHLDQLRTLLDGLRFSFIPCDMWGLGPFRAYMIGLMQDPCELLTTRLDNDDALHHDFVELVQTVAHEQETPVIIDPPYGYVLNERTQQCTPVERPRHHFLSLLEHTMPDEVSTIMADTHPTMGSSFPSVTIESKPMWAEVYHEHNLGNTLPDGKFRPFSTVEELFQ